MTRPLPYPLVAAGIAVLMLGGWFLAQGTGLVVGTALAVVWIVWSSRRMR